MMCALRDVAEQDRVRVRFVCVPDEESEELDERSTDAVVARDMDPAHPARPDFAITGEPTDMHIGIQAKGVLVMRIVVHGRAAHSSTPWLGDNAVLKAIDTFRTIETLPFSRESSEMFDRPSINLGRIQGGDALNQVPDRCEMAVDVRYLPGQDAGRDPLPGPPDPRYRGRADVHPPERRRRPSQSVCACAVGGRRAGDPRRGDVGRPRWRVRRGVVHRGRNPGGRVRPSRRRPSRTGRVGLAAVVVELPAGAGGLRPRAARTGWRSHEPEPTEPRCRA